MNESSQRHDLYDTKQNKKRSKPTTRPLTVTSLHSSSENCLPDLIVMGLWVRNRLQADGHDDERRRRQVLYHRDQVAF